MKELVDEITQLTLEWYKLIGGDHHKDRDCHWHIQTMWSYGDAPKYMVCHYGYILDTIEDYYDTYEEALQGLVDTLKHWIKEEKASQFS